VRDDPNDYVFVERLVSQPRLRTRRHLTLADRDWRAGAQRELCSTITINGVPCELVVEEVPEDAEWDLCITGCYFRVARLTRK
jgi:hypothetical protein